MESFACSELGLVGMPYVYAEDVRYKRTVVEIDDKGRQFEVERSPRIYECRNGNLILDAGRINVLKQIIASALTAPFTGINTFGYAGVGNTNANGTDSAQTRLGFEHIANANRISMTNATATAFANGDIVGEVSGSNTQKVVMQAIWGTGDANNTQVFSEYGIFSTATLPGTNTGTQGVMFARFVPASSITKTSAFQVILNWTLRA